VVVKFGEFLLLEDAELATLASFHETVEGIGYHHLGIQWLILL
jgi:hypothetical protein